jgi:hypothetical protein
MSAIRVFVSHSSTDQALASSLLDCLFACLDLKDDEVRCTSVPGHKLPVGSDIATILRDELSSSAVVIGLLTPSALASSWTLFELGAAWGAGKRILPLIANELDFSKLPGPLGGRHVIRISDENGITQLLDEMQQTLEVSPRSRAKAQAAIKKFVMLHAENPSAPKQAANPRAVKTKVKEPTFGGIPLSELVRVLSSEKITVPAKLAKSDKDQSISVLELFVSNSHIFVKGVISTWEIDTPGGFFYQIVAPKLLPFQLVRFDKLPASRYYRQISLSPTGEKFIAHWKILMSRVQAE